MQQANDWKNWERSRCRRFGNSDLAELHQGTTRSFLFLQNNYMLGACMRFYRPAIPIIFIFVVSVSIFALPTLATHRPSQEAWLSLSSDEVQSGDTIDFSSRLTGFSCSKRYGTYSMAYTLSP